MITEGREEGIKEGELEDKHNVLIRQLELKYSLSEDERKHIHNKITAEHQFYKGCADNGVQNHEIYINIITIFIISIFSIFPKHKSFSWNGLRMGKN